MKLKSLGRQIQIGRGGWTRPAGVNKKVKIGHLSKFPTLPPR